MNLPKLASPRDYVGLFVYDFGEHVSVGYTAEEILMLRRHPSYGGGRAYLIHAVDEAGRLALRGAGEMDLFAEEAMVFGHDTPASAAASYERLTASAKDRPVSCPVRIESAPWAGGEHPHVVALIYKRHVSAAVSAWLLATGFSGGETVSCGAGALADHRRSAGESVASGYLTCRMGCTSRDESEVLSGVHRAIQR